MPLLEPAIHSKQRRRLCSLLAELITSVAEKALLHTLAAEAPDGRCCACARLGGARRILSSF